MLSDDEDESVKKSANVRVLKILLCDFSDRLASLVMHIDAPNEAQDRASRL